MRGIGLLAAFSRAHRKILFHVAAARRPATVLHLQKDPAIAGGFLVLACCGAGNWSLGHATSSPDEIDVCRIA